MNFYQLINILWSRKWIALSVLIMTTVTTLLVSLTLPKQYVATTSIVVEQQSIDPVTGQNLEIGLMPAYIAMQVDIISSHNVARKVVEKLKLNENPKIQEDFVKAKTDSDIKDWIADLLLKQLEIKPSHESNLLQVDFTDIDPKFAATAANAFTDAYIQTSIELHAQPAKLSADWFDTQIASLRENLEHAQSALSTYEQEQGIVATDGNFDLENTRLTDLSRQLMESQAQTSELQSKKDLLTSSFNQSGSAQSLQEVLSSPLIQTLKSELARAEAKFAELSKRVDINHPQYKQAKAEVNNLQQKIKLEIKMVLDSITSGLASSHQRDRILTNALNEQKGKVLNLKKQHDEIAVLKREVENAQRAYDAALQRAGQTRMESEMSQTNISVLNRALPPQKPAKPKILLNMILSIFLGIILGAGSALLSELMDRRVRSAFDITNQLDIPVFAAISGPPSKPIQISRLFASDDSDIRGRM